MNRMLPTVVALSALLAPPLVPSPLAQDARDPGEQAGGRTGWDVLDPAELEVTSLPLDRLDEMARSQLVQLLSNVVGGHVFVDDGVERRLPRFQLVGPSLFVVDRPEGQERVAALVEQLTAQLMTIESPVSEVSEPAPYVLRRFAPRHISLETARLVLHDHFPYAVSTLDELGEMLLEGPEDSIDRVLTMLEELDQPRTQLLLELRVLGSVGEAHEGRLPAELTGGLSELLPGRHYVPLTDALLRTSAGNRNVSLLTSMTDQAEVGMSIGRCDVDPERGIVTLDGCRLTLSPRRVQTALTQGGATAPTTPAYQPVNIDTSVSLQLGEYVVLASSGSSNLLFVLRVTEV